jgi:hypothetical protein
MRPRSVIFLSVMQQGSYTTKGREQDRTKRRICDFFVCCFANAPPLTAAELPELTYSQSPVSCDFTDDETLRVGAFNIQVFGTTKASKPEVMDVLGKIICTYDVVAIQEIRDISQTALPALVDIVNSGDPHYEYNVSERLGRLMATSMPLLSRSTLTRMRQQRR